MTDSEKIFALAHDSTVRFAPEKLNWSWGQALYLYSLALLDEQSGKSTYLSYLKRYYDHHLLTGYRINTSDTCAPALGALALAEKTGDPRYFSIVHRAERYLESAPKVLEDMPNHFGNGPESLLYPKSIWIDSIMMYGVFASRYGRRLNDDKLLSFAEKQPATFAKYLFDPEEKLFYHCYWSNFQTHYPVSKTFWGRGNGWVMASIPLFLEYFRDGPAKDEAVSIFQTLSASLLGYQRENGYFGTVINKADTYEEASATMLIASGWFYGCRTGLLGKEYLTPAEKAYHAVAGDIELKNGLWSMTKISPPTSAIPPSPYLFYKFVPRGNDWNYGLAAAIFALLQHEAMKG